MMLLVMTVYSLFFDDYRRLACQKPTDFLFDIFCYVLLASFSLEIFLSSVLVKTYFNSYYFYLDIISTLSLIIDLSQIKFAILQLK